MDIQNAKQILGFDPNSQPAPEEVDQAYSKALSSLIKAEFSGEDVSEKREALELALQTISQPVRDNQVSSAPLVPHMPTATYQKPDQAPIPVIHISDWSGAGQARINYLTCPFCYTEVAEGFQVCPDILDDPLRAIQYVWTVWKPGFDGSPRWWQFWWCARAISRAKSIRRRFRAAGWNGGHGRDAGSIPGLCSAIAWWNSRYWATTRWSESHGHRSKLSQDITRSRRTD